MKFFKGLIMQVSVETDVKKTAGWLGQYGKQIPFATAFALTKTAKEGAADMRKAFNHSFSAPTKYTLNSIFVKPANKRDLMAVFGVKDTAKIQKSGGLTPADILAVHFTGGVSKPMRYEQAFKRIGLLGHNEDIVPGRNLKELNRYGNVPPSLIIKLISYFGGFGEQGYKANASVESKAKLARRTNKSTKGKRATKYAKINGVVYFYSSGTGLNRHLHKGIWAKTGIHGVDVRPILMFVKRAKYRKRFDITKFAVNAQTRFGHHFSESLDYAMRTAK